MTDVALPAVLGLLNRTHQDLGAAGAFRPRPNTDTLDHNMRKFKPGKKGPETVDDRYSSPQVFGEPGVPAERAAFPDATGEIASDHPNYDVMTSAGDTLTGATSEDVNRGTGAPYNLETSVEERHKGDKSRKRIQYGYDVLATNNPETLEDERRMVAEDASPSEFP
ncbi:hypothetical protein KEM52_006126 [Ascosphaera acerosa]|nr:hypothetical protein KEM52_006126 [Ascosphaera acerosa]